MFTPEFFIDTIQTSKRVVTNYVFTDKVLNKAANNYIDAQSAFAKMLVRNAVDLTKYSVDTVSTYVFPKKEQATPAPYNVEPKAPKSKKVKQVEEVANTDINTQGE